MYEGKELCKSVLETISDGFFVLETEELVVTYFNKAAEKLLKRKANDVINKPLFEAFPEAKGSIFEKKYRQAYTENISIMFETYFGIEPYIDWYTVKVYPGNNKISVLFQVITENKQLEFDLINTRNLLNEAEKAGKIGGWQLDPTTLNQTWTDEVFRILEIDLEQGAPKVPKGLDFIDPDFRPEAEKAVQEAMERGTPYNQEWKITTAKGNKKWVNAICIPIMENGKLVKISGSFQDITDRKNTEDQLKVANQQLAANEQQLKAANQQLAANEQQLKAANQQLAANEQQLKAANQQLLANEQQLRAANQQLLANEKQLRTSKETAERYLNLAAEIIISLDKKGNITLLNDSGHQLLGYENGELIGKNWFDNCLPKTNKKEIKNVFKQIMNGQLENVETYESNIQTQSEEIRTIFWHNTTLYDDNGNITGTLSSGEDITEKIKAEEKFRLAMEATEDGIWDWDIKSGQVYYSPSWLKIIEEEEVQPDFSTWGDRIHLDDKEEALSRVQDHVNGKTESFSMEHRLLLKNKEWKWVLGRGKVVSRDEKGNALRMVGTMTDISERKQTEEKLKQSEEKYRLYFDHAPVGYQSLDKNGNVLDVNASWLRILGYKRNDVIGHWFGNFLHPDQQNIFKQLFPENIKRKDIINGVEFILRHKNGTFLTCEYTANIQFDSTGNFVRTHCVFQDISEKKSAEKELKRIEWLLEKENIDSLQPEKDYMPVYGDVTKLNTERTILDNVGADTLKILCADIMNLLDTSIAVYEINGDYAYGQFDSNWCQAMDKASFLLCKTQDSKEALNCGKWLCHENCWNDSAKAAINTQKPTDIECIGGIHLYGVPIYAGMKIIGAINMGYGTPPNEEKVQKELAEKFNIRYKVLAENASQYKARPAFIIENAKKRLATVAQLIGEIVERKGIEKALKKNQAELNTLIKSAPICIKKVDPNFNLQFMSEAGIQQLKVGNVNELYGKPYPFYFFPKDFKKVMHEKLQEAKATGSIIQLDGILCDTIGNMMWYNHIIAPVKTSMGQLDYLLVLSTDISERKKAVEKLKESEENLKNTFNISPGIIAKANLITGYFIEANQAVTRILGYSVEEFTSRPFMELIHPDDQKNTTAEKNEQIKGKNVTFFENRYLCKNGSYKWMAWHGTKADKNGIVTAIGSDITERKQAEEKIQKSENRFRAMFENHTAMMLLIEPDNGKIIAANKSASDYYGYSQAELATMNVNNLNTARAELVKKWRTEAKRNETNLFTFKHRLKNGHERDVRVHSTPIEYKNEKILFSIIFDITEQKKAEKRIEQDLLEKETLLKELHHRTKNNMNVIISMLAIKSRASGNKVLQEMVKEITGKIKSMALVHKQLYQSKDLSKINLNDYIRDLTMQIDKSYAASNKHIEIRYDMQDIYVMIDIAIPLGLVINELITNSYKYAWPDVLEGTLQIGLCRGKDDAIIFTLADDGIGLKQNFDLKKDKNLGLETVQMLSENQLDGILTFENSNGVSWRLKFNDEHDKEREAPYRSV